MNHYKWKNLLVNGEFIDPVKGINETGIRLNPSFNNSVFYYGSSADEIQVANYAEYSMVAVTEEELLSDALAVNDSAIVQDDLIIFPNLEKLYGGL